MIELVHKRKWNSKIFDTGRVDAEENPIYASKLQNGLHDIEPDRSFVDCDTKFRPYAIGVSTDKVIRNRCGEVRISDTASESKDLAKVKTKNNCGVSLKLKGHRTYGPHFDDLKSTYYTTSDGITLKYYPNYKGINIVIVIDNPLTASNIYRFTLQEYGCSYVYEKTEEGIKCISSTGKDDIYIKALYAKDAEGNYGSVYIDLDGIEDGRQVIKKTIAPVWLGNAVGPVEVDPSVTIDDDSGTLIDTILGKSLPDNNNGARTSWFAYKASASDQNTGLIKVDLTAYSGITVTLAYFGIDIYFFVGGTQTIDTLECLKAWIEGTKNNAPASAGEPTWNSQIHNANPAWATSGCEGSGTDHAVTAESATVLTGTNSDQHFNLTTTTVQGHIDNSSSNNGFTVITQDTSESGKAWLARSSEASVGNIPYFYMEYTEVVGGFPFFFDAGHY